MDLKCRFGWHNWKNWSMTPLSRDGGKRWFAGQGRQCADCYLLQIRPFDTSVAIDLRPLRNAVWEHLAVVEALNGEAPESVKVAANNLREELRKDEGRLYDDRQNRLQP